MTLIAVRIIQKCSPVRNSLATQKLVDSCRNYGRFPE